MKISIKQYSQTLFDLTENKSQEEILIIVKKFAEILKENGQLKNTEKIMEKFGELYNEAHGIILAEIVSREKLNDELVEKLKSYIKEKYSAKVVEIENIIDEKIKGGIIIRVGDEIIDGSVANELKKLKNILSK
jgi:F-type H+-transporting ATPase subunit delta